MMKTAVLLFGDYREFESASVSYQVFEHLDVDFFVSTWDKTLEYGKYYDTKTKDITVDKINRYLPSNAVFTSIANEKGLSDFNFTQKMVYHWKTLGKALRDSAVEYDIAILLRIDFYIKVFDYSKLVEEGTDGKLHVDFKGLDSRDDGTFYVGDVHHSGSPELVLKYIDMLPLNPPLASHMDFGSILRYSNIEVASNKAISGMLLRPTTSKLLGNNHARNLEFLERNYINYIALYEMYTNWWHKSDTYGDGARLPFKEYLSKNYLDGFINPE